MTSEFQMYLFFLRREFSFSIFNRILYKMGKFGVTEWIVIFFFSAFYFVPILIAVKRNAIHRMGIILLNILAGWTLLGWVAALIWSIADKKEAEVNYRQ